MEGFRSWLPSYATNRINRRKFLAGAAAGAGAAALIACGGGGETKQVITIDPSGVRTPGAVVYGRDEWKLADETKQAVAGGIYPGRESSDLPSSWDPWLANVGTVENFNAIAYEYLIKWNRGPGIEPGSPEYQENKPHLAQDWELSNDALTYTFTLRPGVKFHPVPPVNSRDMTIEDWRTTFDKFIAIGTNRAALMEIMDKIEYPDSKHMTIKLKEPYAPFALRMADRQFAPLILPKELNANDDLRANTVIGTNYRIFDKLQPSITREFRKWDGYWRGKPFIDRWHYPIITEAANAYAQFLAKNIISYSPGARDVLKLRGDAPDAIMVGSTLDYGAPRGIFGKYESTTAPWKDPRVRIAIRKSINFEAIQDFQSNKAAFQAVGIEPELAYTTHSFRDPGYWLDPRKGELGADSANYLYDPAEANKLVVAAGHPNGFDIEYVALVGSRVEVQQLMIDELKKSTLIRPKELFWNMQQYYDDIIYSANFKGLQITSAGGGSSVDIDYVLFQNFHSGGPATAYPDPKMDELIRRQRREMDYEKRVEALHEFQRYAARTFNIEPTWLPFGSFGFEWPWLHNVNQEGYLQWLDPNMPRRNG
jgi:peptide/nickel transport system substrate-binding protein